MIGGDGFDVVWNAKRGDWVMGSVYFNDLLVSKNAGLSWNDAVSGLNDKGSGKASFYSPLGNARSNPDWVYAAGTSGVWYSSDFGGNWKLAPITSEWAFGSLCQVKVSLAYNRIVWAGSRMSETGKLFVSTNGGKSFSATKNYETETMGAISGMATHPTEANTAYALFSFADAPKILRTKDLGQTWEDITGFEGGNDESNNGFPDVAVYDLLVMPHATNTIWAGTEIGIVESTDNGASWHLLDANLPAVAVVDMKVADQQVVIGTHGRGIWTVDIPELPAIPLLETPKIVFASVATGNKARVRFSISSGFDSVQFFLSNEYMGSSTNTGDVDAIFSNLTPEASYIVKGIAFHNGNQYPSEDVTLVNVVSKQGFDSYSNRFNANPGSDFSGVGFGVRTEAGFFNPAIHSEHVYRDGGEYTYELLKGITIAASNANFFYRDVAIVEPGEPGSVFGEPAFNDYVVLEASLDRINWFAVGDGYDADAYPEWQQAFADASAGTAQMFKDRNINLLDYFMPGEIVYFRFRMYANSSVAGWGWAIDDIFIQENAPLGFEEDMANELLALQAYPNPAIGQTNIAFYLPQASEVSLNLVDASGKQTTRTIRKGRMNAGRHELPLPLNGVPKGVYLLQLHAEGQQRIFRLLVQ